MENLVKDLISPDILVSLVVFAFGLGGVWKSLNSRIEELEEFKKEANILDLHTKIAEIQKDIEWLKNYLSSKKK